MNTIKLPVRVVQDEGWFKILGDDDFDVAGDMTEEVATELARIVNAHEDLKSAVSSAFAAMKRSVDEGSTDHLDCIENLKKLAGETA